MSYKYLFFALLPFLAISCQEDETLDLVDYPNTAISLSLIPQHYYKIFFLST